MEQNHGTNFLAISILAAAIIVGGSFIYGNSLKAGGGAVAQVAGGVGGAGEEEDNSPAVKPDEARLLDDDVILGDPKAPVTFAVFGDFQCPYCSKLYKEVEMGLREEFIAKKIVKMVNRDLPLDSIHPYARRAAEAAECARDQGKYWAYHDMLYENQGRIPTMNYADEAGKLGMNKDQFKQCVDSGKYKDEVEKDSKEAVALGLRGTPGVFVNGKLFPGAFPYADFKAAILEALKGTEAAN